MKNTLSPTEKTPTEKNWMWRIRKTVEAALLSAGILSGTIAHAQEPENATPPTPLEQSQKLNQFYLGKNQQLQGTIESLWSQLKDDNSSVPETPFDEHHNITPEFQQFLVETLPKEHIGLAIELAKTQEKLNQLPAESIWQKEQKLIIFVSLTLLLAFILYSRKEMKDKKTLEQFYADCCELTGETDVEKIKAFFGKIEGTDELGSWPEEEDAPNEEAIALAEDSMWILSQLKALPGNTLCILTPAEGDPWYIYARERHENPEGTVWDIQTKSAWFTMQITEEGEIELEHNRGGTPEKYTTPLSTFTSLVPIDLGNNDHIEKYNQHSLSNPIDVNEWYLTQLGISENTLTPGEKILVKTNSSVYILEVQADGSYKVLPETPQGSFPANTFFQCFNAAWQLLTKSGDATTQVTNMIRLSPSAPSWTQQEVITLDDTYTPPTEQEINAINGLSQLESQRDALLKHAEKRQSERADGEELESYQTLLWIFATRIGQENVK